MAIPIINLFGPGRAISNAEVVIAHGRFNSTKNCAGCLQRPAYGIAKPYRPKRKGIIRQPFLCGARAARAPRKYKDK